MTVQQEAVLPAIPPALPPGWARRAHLAIVPTPAAAVPLRQTPPAAAVLTTVTAANGRPVTIHRADYDAVDALGEYTVHGYAWRCPACPRLETGYSPRGFALCLRDARAHDCAVRDA